MRTNWLERSSFKTSTLKDWCADAEVLFSLNWSRNHIKSIYFWCHHGTHTQIYWVIQWKAFINFCFECIWMNAWNDLSKFHVYELVFEGEILWVLEEPDWLNLVKCLPTIKIDWMTSYKFIFCQYWVSK